MKSDMTNRWIALYVENEVGVLAKVSGLFSAKSYNLLSLTVGTTEREDVSRMTICVSSDDITFEQIKKQLNSMVEVIKVIDLTNVPIHMKEILFAKVTADTPAEKESVFQIAQVFSGSHFATWIFDFPSADKNCPVSLRTVSPIVFPPVPFPANRRSPLFRRHLLGKLQLHGIQQILQLSDALLLLHVILPHSLHLLQNRPLSGSVLLHTGR